MYDNFYIVAFPNDLELCCLFMEPQGVEKNISQLKKIASKLVIDMDVVEEDNEQNEESSQDTVEEIKRLITNLLSGTEMSTPDLRRYFKLSSSQIWKVMSNLESAQKIRRTDKKQGRAVFWTAI